MKRFSASSAQMLMTCPASGNLDIAIPGWTEPVVDPEAGAKGRGTIMHELAANVVGELTARELHGFAQAMTYVAELRKSRRFKVLVEDTRTAEWLQTKPKTTVDLVLYTQDELHIVDYKTGKIPVSVVDNKQMLYYALTWADLAPKATGIWLHIVQPWADGAIESVFVSPNDLAAFMADAKDAEQKLIDKDTTFVPSDACTFCPANPHSRGDKGYPYCPAMMQLLYPMGYDEDEILNL